MLKKTYLRTQAINHSFKRPPKHLLSTAESDVHVHAEGASLERSNFFPPGLWSRAQP